MNSVLFSFSLIFSALLVVLVGISYCPANSANAQTLNSPTVKITSPAEGQKINYINNNAITFSGISSDNTTSNCQVSIIFISAHSDEWARKRALEADAVDLLQKPFSGDALLNAINFSLEIQRRQTSNGNGQESI